MRTLNVTLTDPLATEMSISYPNEVAFMYSRQPVIIKSAKNPGDLVVSVAVTCWDTNTSYRERRSFHNSVAEFDISRIMQLLAPDVDTIFSRLDSVNSESGSTLSVGFTVNFEYIDPSNGYPASLADPVTVTGMYGALDQGETYGARMLQKRLWLNLPQTLTVWKNVAGGIAGIVINQQTVKVVDTADKACYEMDVIHKIGQQENAGELLSLLVPCRRMDIARSWKPVIKNGTQTSSVFVNQTVIPDDSTLEDGTYLRWLNRSGEVSYWLFTNSQLRVAASERSSFARHYEGDPTVPSANIYRNAQKADFRETREMVVGAVGLSPDEYEELGSLATSPVVDMLVSMEEGVNTWQRVNVSASSYSRNIRRKTPNLQDIEFIIRLPERNTVQL